MIRSKVGLTWPLPLDDTCVLFIGAEDSLGTTYLDKSEYHNDATRTKAAQCNGPDRLGLSFDGTNDYLSVADAASLDCSAVTIAAWVKLDAAWAADGYILAKCEDSNSQFSYGLYVDSTRHPVLVTSSNGSSPSAEGAIDAISLAPWHHVVATFEETVPPAVGTYLIYVDGVLVASNGSGADPSIHIGTGRMTIGARWDVGLSAPYNLFNGLMDDVLVFNRVLSAAEIHDLYTVCGPC